MSIGKICEFQVRTGNWTLFVERAEMYFKVNDLKEELWLPTLIAAMGDEAYELLSNLTSPMKPGEKTYGEVVALLTDHLQPKPSTMAERFRFRQRRQSPEESIQQYISELKKLTKYCDFRTALEENIRDQLVCGLKSDVIRQRLFAEEDLTYARAVKVACAMEAAERDAAVVESGRPGEGGTLHAVDARARGSGGGSRGRFSAGSWQQKGGKDDSKEQCGVCGATGHRNVDCRFRNYICGKCKRSGHLRRVCPRRDGGVKQLVAQVQAREPASRADDMKQRPSRDERTLTSESESDLEEEMHQLCLNGYKPVSLTISIDKVDLPMEIDTGSLISCISEKTFSKYFRDYKLTESNLVLNFYDGTKVRPLGVITPKVEYGTVSKRLELFIIKGGTTSLLGRQWLSELKISIPNFHNNVIPTSNNSKLSDILSRFKELFAPGLGRFRGGKARLHVREGATPVFFRARPLPYALRERVEKELEGMLRDGVIEPIESSDWATPLVPVRKADGGLRLCVDYKVTLNPVLHIDRYPLPRIDDLIVNMNGAKVFTKIDLSQAYNQVELDDPDNLTVINTHKGLFKYKRLVFGLSSSPGIFQRIMANLLKHIPNVEVFLDDILIGTPCEATHLVTLGKVLQRLHENGMKIKTSKCSFMVDEIKYLGYVISKDGIKADPDKVEAIVKIPRPKDVSELRSFLGIVNFYAKFAKNLSSILAPLYILLKKGYEWKWDSNCELAFTEVKSILTSTEVLMHYNPNKPLYLTCDASSHGIGGVLTQLDAKGKEKAIERPVVYVSRSLTEAEKHYSQIEKEALAIVFCCKKLHQYLYGRKFTLRTDHKPLVTIFGPKQGIPTMVASRLQRWAIKLSAYTYEIEYVSSQQNGADGFSRLPIVTCKTNKIPELTYLHFAHDEILLNYSEIKKQTEIDPCLNRVLLYLRDGWPAVNEIAELGPYINRKNELYEELGCVMWGYRVIIPVGCREKVLQLLHEPHMGIVKTKAFARSYVWWPGIDEAIERVCKQCEVCAAEADAPPRHAPVSWPWPQRPWTRIHIDFLGPIAGKTYLVVVDARTKWIEVFHVPSTAAEHTLLKLSELFSRWGLPKQIVSDNGPPFTSNEFSKFTIDKGIEHLFSAPYHPASNGAAENAVRTIKRVIKKSFRQKVDTNLMINTFLLHYRNTEHCTTGESPASLMLGRRLRTTLDLLRPDVEYKVRVKQENQQSKATKSERCLEPGDTVWLRQYNNRDKWVAGEVRDRLSTTDYRVVDTLGRDLHKHIDQLRQRRSSLICSPGITMEEPQGTTLPDRTPTSVTMPKPQSTERSRVVEVVPESMDEFYDCLNPVIEEAPPQSPSPTEPPQTRPIRTCRLEKTPKYKF